MDRHDLTPDQLLDLLARPTAAEDVATTRGALLVVEGDAGAAPTPDRLARVAGLPAVIVRVSDADRPDDDPMADVVDVVVPPGDDDLAAIEATVGSTPLAATALALLLRAGPAGSVEAGLVAESAVYSTLQAGPEFAAWRARRPVVERPAPDTPVVDVERHGTRLDVVLDRPEVRNALDARLRDELCEALTLAVVDPAITEVHLRGNGPSFCAGGDLDEFGSLPDPATAHLVRLTRSPARLLAALAPRVTAHLHGACMGSGIELPAFARRVVAHPDTVVGLPELGLGLIPGAGGTVSLPARIGRHRTALLALTARPVDAPTAHAWGLVDGIGSGPVVVVEAAPGLAAEQAGVDHP
ncbi:MAG TPA: enoyl-CoA hydratase/isomerase family protein [Acidimicrobiales bacterium]|nr:enoyl-CoA hydratase/isomerase family protein [Acidimicrobiales bacterium]